MLHKCILCQYETINLTNYKTHILSEKHKLLLHHEQIQKEIKEDREIILHECKTINKKLDKVTNKINKVQETANEAKIYSKSCIAMLNDHFRDNPPLLYPGDEQCRQQILKYFKLTEEEIKNNFKLEDKILSKYKNNKLIESLIDILIPILKKDDAKKQSIFNTDTSRCNYAAKQTNIWISDKAGVYLNENMDTLNDTQILDGFEKLENIMNCVISIRDKKLYDSIIYKLSSNLHYKSLIKTNDIEEKIIVKKS